MLRTLSGLVPHVCEVGLDAATKSASGISFIDELDSIGRTQRAGLGGRHDEQKQTLNLGRVLFPAACCISNDTLHLQSIIF